MSRSLQPIASPRGRHVPGPARVGGQEPHGAAPAHGDTWLQRQLAVAAMAAARDKDSYFAAQYAQLVRRRARQGPQGRRPFAPRRDLAHAQHG